MNDPVSITHPWDLNCPFCRNSGDHAREAEAEAERRRRVVGEGLEIARFIDDAPPPKPAWAKD